jgi:hypothetical protein
MVPSPGAISISTLYTIIMYPFHSVPSTTWLSLAEGMEHPLTSHCGTVKTFVHKRKLADAADCEASVVLSLFVHHVGCRPQHLLQS